MPHTLVEFHAVAPEQRPTRNLLLAIYQDIEANREHLVRRLGATTAQMVMELLEQRHLSGRYKEFNLLSCRGLREDLDWLLLMGLGNRKDCSPDYRLHDRIRSVTAIAARHFRRKYLDTFAVDDFSDFGVPEWLAGRLIADGVTLGVYRFRRYKKSELHEKFNGDLNTRAVFILSDGDRVALQRSADLGNVCSVNTCRARDLVNTPAADLTPIGFAEEARKAAADLPGLSVEILSKADMEKENMRLHLAVARGSDNEPCVAILKYAPRGEAAGWDLALVGKGVTFDAGGYDIKPSPHMERMYGDMAGAAAVLGCLRSVAQLELDHNVVGVMPLAENLVNGKAYKPGDIIESRKGLTVEIRNTDAEGRLLLADALDFACERFEPRFLVDIATLTGTIISALGHFVTGLFASGRDMQAGDAFAGQLEVAGQRTGEWVWRMPIDDDYKVQLASDVADLENCDTDRAAGAGAITAAVFLKEFVDFEKVEAWAHLDIAGTSLMERTLIYNKCPYQPKEGATGVGARLLTRLAAQLAHSDVV